MPEPVTQQLDKLTAGYDKDSQELTLTFENGQSYTYTAVPPDVYEGLVKSGSPLRYYNTRIRGLY